jgi:hypothetical protein
MGIYKMKVKLIGLPHIGSSGVYFGLRFNAVGNAKLSRDGKSFTGVALIADAKEDLLKSLLEADRVEEVTDAEYKALVAKASKNKKATD